MGGCARRPIVAIEARSWSRPGVGAVTVWARVPMGGPFSAVTSGDVGLGARLAWVGEDFQSVAIFDAVAEVEESGALRDTRGLLPVVGDDDDAVAAPKRVAQLLALGGGARIERHERLGTQEQYGNDRGGAGSAKPILVDTGTGGSTYTGETIS